MRKLASVSVVVTLVAGALVGLASPGHAVHGCILANPSPGAQVPDQPNIGPSECTIEITPGGAYNATVVAEAWSVIVRNQNGDVVATFGANQPPGRYTVSADGANIGGSIEASVLNGGMVVGCAACEPPPA